MPVCDSNASIVGCFLALSLASTKSGQLDQTIFFSVAERSFTVFSELDTFPQDVPHAVSEPAPIAKAPPMPSPRNIVRRDRRRSFSRATISASGSFGDSG